MAVFANLSERLSHIFSKLKSRGKLTELEIKQAMREVRIALLEADVNYQVAKDFIARVSEKAVGEEILKSLTPGQHVIKIVNDELIALMGSSHSKLNVDPNPPTVIMMCGLQGAGKTTMCGKLAHMLKGQRKSVMLAACDIYRPAAITQLQIVGKNAGVPVFEMGAKNPVKIAQEAYKEAKNKTIDVLIIDTAGRLHINEDLMRELEEIKKEIKPAEILLTVDAMTGQDAVTVADTFNKRLDVTGIVLTKLDGDTRGGAALSIKAVTGKPIKFTGVGEKIGDISPFHPERLASSILGMGDVLTLIEKAQQAVSEDDVKRLEKSFRENSFTLDDFLLQIDSLKKMGNIQELLAMMPQQGKMKISDGDIDENQIKRFKSIIQSMTMKERLRPDIIKAGHRKRIAMGSGTTIQDVNQLLKQFEQSKLLMKQMNNPRGGKMKLPF